MRLVNELGLGPAARPMTPPIEYPALELRLPGWAVEVTADLGGRETDWRHAAWWWLGVHGGAGVTTLAAMLPGGSDGNRRWPDPAKGGPRAVVLVARSSAHGLRCLRGALRQHAAGDTPDGLHVVGVAVVADRPGRLPRHLVQEVGMLAGIASAVWRVPWLSELLEPADPLELPLPPALHNLSRDLACLRIVPESPNLPTLGDQISRHSPALERSIP